MSRVHPFVSVIMPVRNEAEFIAASLTAVLEQDYPPDRMEVLVVDGMSDDGTRAIVADVSSRYPDVSVSLLDNPRRIAPAALNIGLRRARGDIIVRVDGHCEIARDYLSRCVEHLQTGEVDGVGGPIETVATTPVGETIAAAMSSPFGVGNSAFRTVDNRTMMVDTVAFPAYTRAAILRAGLFDEELVRNQDDEYNFRLRKFGGKIRLAPDVRSRYYSRASLRSLWKQYFQYGYWKVRVMQKHPRQMRARHFAPPAFVLALLGGGLLAPFVKLARYLWGGVFLLYTLANLSASIWTARKKGWKHLPLLPVTFAVLHVSYGLGFLVGLVKFAGRWGDQ